MIELGKTLPLIDEAHKTDDKLIKGCQSRVWLHSELKDGKVIFTARRDAIITKGIVAILVRAFPIILLKKFKRNTDFIDKIGLKEHLSPTRANSWYQ